MSDGGSPAVSVTGTPMDVLAMSLVGSLGYDVDTACAAARAGLVRPSAAPGFRTRSAVDGEPESVTVHAARLLTDGFQDDARLVRLLQGAIADLRRRLPPHDASRRLAAYLSVPSPDRLHEGALLADVESVRASMQAESQAAAQADADDPQAAEQRVARVARLFARACAAAGWSATVPLASVSFDGHAGGALALARASADLAADRIDLAVVGGVASWLDEDTLQWLLNTGRLKCDANPSGFQPGEAASLLVLRRTRGDGASPVIGPIAIAHDARSLYSGLPAYGEGLAAAIGAVLDPAAPVAWFVADLNGETHRAHDWGNAVVRLRPGRDALDAPQVWTPAAWFGDVDAASVPVAVCVAITSALRGAAPARQACVVSSSDGPVRAAIQITLSPAGSGLG
jgi:3-oxoacyl-[acyl-carrier-protein] synthase I